MIRLKDVLLWMLAILESIINQAVLAAMDPNIVWNEAEGNSLADGNPYIGPEAVLNGVFTRVLEQWDNFKLVNIKQHDMSENQVLTTLRYNATVKATGKKN